MDQLSISTLNKRIVRSYSFVGDENSSGDSVEVVRDDSAEDMPTHGLEVISINDTSTNVNDAFCGGDDTTLIPPAEPVLTPNHTPDSNSFGRSFSLGDVSVQSVAVQRVCFAFKFLFVVLILSVLVGTFFMFGQIQMLQEEIDLLKQMIHEGKYPLMDRPATSTIAPFHYAWSVFIYHLYHSWTKLTHSILGFFST